MTLFQGASLKSAFGTFTGFKTTPVTNSSPFSFLANVSTTSSTTTSIASTTIVNTNSKGIESGNASKAENKNKTDNNVKTQAQSNTSKKSLDEQDNAKTKKSHSSEYYAKLKGLNESVATWIKTHVDANPFCILTPIFKDYEKYLKEIKEEEAKTQTSHAAQQTTKNDSKKDVTVEKKPEISPFGSSNATTSTLSTGTEWKSEKSIFSNITANTKSIFGNAEQKTDSSKSVFGSSGSTDVTPDKSRSIFGSVESSAAGKSVFCGSTAAEKNPFLRKPAVSDSVKAEEEATKSDTKPIATTFPASTFSFGQSSTTSNASAGFSFGR